MHILSEKESQEVSAGVLPLIAEAFLIGIAIFAAPKVIQESNNYLNQVGQGIGEATWEHFHPYDPNK